MKKVVLALVALFTVGSVMAQSKVGHINAQKVLDTMPSHVRALEDLQNHEEEGILELQELQADLEAAYKKYEAGKLDRTPIMNQLEEEKLMKKQEGLQARQQELQVEAQRISQSLNQPILDKLKEAVKIVAERNKLSYIIDESSALYFDGGTDYTDQVITEVLKLDI